MTLTFQYDKIFQRENLEELVQSAYGSYQATEVKKSFTEGGRISYVSYRFPSLNPGVAVKVDEPFPLCQTKLFSEVPFTSKDGVKGMVKVGVEYSIKFVVSASARDVPISVFPITVSVEQADSMDQLMRGRVRAYVDEQQNEVRRSLGFFKYLGALLFSSPKGNALLVYVPVEPVGDATLHAYSGTEKQQVDSVVFDLLIWKNLWSASKSAESDS